MAQGMPHARERGAKKTLKSIELERAANGGHVVTHRYTSSTGEYHEPEVHTFAKDEGDKMLAHVGKHMGVDADKGDGDGDEDDKY